MGWRDAFDDQAEFNQLLLMGQSALFIAINTGVPLIGEKPKPEWLKAFEILEETKTKGMSMETNSDENLVQACFMMGQAYYGTREYAKAAKAIEEGRALAASCNNRQSEVHASAQRVRFYEQWEKERGSELAQEGCSAVQANKRRSGGI